MAISKAAQSQIESLRLELDRVIQAARALEEERKTLLLQVRRLNETIGKQDRAYTVMQGRLMQQLPVLVPDAGQTLKQFCQSYCAQHGVRTVPAAAVKAWRQGLPA